MTFNTIININFTHFGTKFVQLSEARFTVDRNLDCSRLADFEAVV